MSAVTNPPCTEDVPDGFNSSCHGCLAPLKHSAVCRCLCFGLHISPDINWWIWGALPQPMCEGTPEGQYKTCVFWFGRYRAINSDITVYTHKYIMMNTANAILLVGWKIHAPGPDLIGTFIFHSWNRKPAFLSILTFALIKWGQEIC